MGRLGRVAPLPFAPNHGQQMGRHRQVLGRSHRQLHQKPLEFLHEEKDPLSGQQTQTY